MKEVISRVPLGLLKGAALLRGVTLAKWTILAACLVAAQMAQARDVLEWLNQASQASRGLNYTGTYFYYHGEHTEVLRVLHRVDGKTERNKLEVLDGPHREFIRINDEVYCHLADGKTVRVDRNAVQRFFPSVIPDSPANLASHYIPKLGGAEKVAGRDCQVVILEPRDGYRYTHMVWLDQTTALPLKTRTVDGRGASVSMFVFSEIEVGKQPDKAVFDVRMAGKRVQAAGFAAIDKDSEWVMKPPPGFVRTFEVMRPLHGRKNMVLHRVYSDGMSNFSMFIEPAMEDIHALEGLSTEGAINIYSRRVDGHKVTALGEVPATTLLEAANSVQRK